MRIYFGLSRENELQLLKRAGVKNYLFSFYNIRGGVFDINLIKQIKNSDNGSASIMIDSGAFNYLNMGVKDYPISYLDSYIEFLKYNDWVDYWVIPDVIGDLDRTVKNVDYMIKSGANIEKGIYVVHFRGSSNWYDILKNAYDIGFRYFGVGVKSIHMAEEHHLKLLRDVKNMVNDYDSKLHLFGFGSEDILFRFIPDSTDTTAWAKLRIGGAIKLSDGSRSYYSLLKSNEVIMSNMFNFDILRQIVDYGAEDMINDYMKLFALLSIKHLQFVERVINHEELRQMYMKIKSESPFTQRFYTEISNYLYSLSGDSVVFDTPRRWINALTEYLSGYRYSPHDVAGRDFPAPTTDEIIKIKIPFSSLCIHHLLPFYGYVFIEYRPSDKILGLSKFSRVVNVLSRRLQIQERLTKEIYDVLNDVLEPRELKVKVRAKHLCCRDRGVRIGSVFETEVSSSGSGDDREGTT